MTQRIICRTRKIPSSSTNLPKPAKTIKKAFQIVKNSKNPKNLENCKNRHFLFRSRRAARRCRPSRHRGRGAAAAAAATADRPIGLCSYLFRSRPSVTPRWVLSFENFFEAGLHMSSRHLPSYSNWTESSCSLKPT